jgi:hypothetical protein
MATNTTDPEKGLPSVAARSMMPPWASSAQGNVNDGHSSTPTPLQLFQLLVGINTPPTLLRDKSSPHTESRRTGPDNIGLYQRAIGQERASRIAYLSTAFISNTLYMLQILLAATFTALSAYKDSRPVVLTVLGAVNTVVAG